MLYYILLDGKVVQKHTIKDSGVLAYHRLIVQYGNLRVKFTANQSVIKPLTAEQIDALRQIDANGGMVHLIERTGDHNHKWVVKLAGVNTYLYHSTLRALADRGLIVWDGSIVYTMLHALRTQAMMAVARANYSRRHTERRVNQIIASNTPATLSRIHRLADGWSRFAA